MSPTTYKRPPITEAVIEIRTDRKIDRQVIEKIARRLKTRYVNSETEENIQIAFDRKSKDQKNIKREWSGLKLSTKDRADIVLLRVKSLGTSRLAPYCGWEEFRSRAFENWETWRKAVGQINVTRVGVRYINRIDVPKATFRLEDYIGVVPSFPLPGLPPMTSYTLQVRRPLGEDGCDVTLNSGVVPSPLIDHTSLLLDIDVYSTEVAPGGEQTWSLIDRIRHHKNKLFEASVTDLSRELFNQ